jgi:serine/threonine protein kinase
MSATSEQTGGWQRLEELFSQAIDLPESERESFVRRECADDAALCQEVLGLIACDTGQSTGPLTHAVGAAIDATSRDRRRAILGTLVGNYSLVSVLGHGGTGNVYLGERADKQYTAKVAIKIVDTATSHPELGVRFRAEQQILASLNHPNIARLLDAGETPTGAPYLAMEYVQGEPLDKYCDERSLGLTPRLELFLQICSAVQYAHQNLVVHRDLKPANILVTAEGTPKLLDFGIAKLLDTSQEAAAQMLTRMNDRLLTPEYASPEQIHGRPVTTASDVYALGVVLYELLTGLRPYVIPVTAGQLELERLICVLDPARPSAAVRRAIVTPPPDEVDIRTLAALRGVPNPERLARRLMGDLDAIVLRALRKEPEHRYGSVEQLAADIRRFLAREPVLARQGNWVYYSQRFLRRHAFGVATVTIFIVLLVVFSVMTSLQAQRIAMERDRATQESERAEIVSSFMLQVFSSADPFESQGQQINARELLDRAGRRIQGDLNQQPEVRARLLEAMGRAYRRQLLTDKAIEFLNDALAVRRRIPEAGRTHEASILAELAIALRDAGQFEQSDRASRQALELTRAIATQGSINYARLLADVGRMEHARGNVALADKYLQQSATLMRQLRGPQDRELAAVLFDISAVNLWKNDLIAAERYAREVTAIYRSTLPELHPDRVEADLQLGEILFNLSRLDEAATLLGSALVAQRKLYGESSSRAANTLVTLALVRQAQDRLEDAEQLASEALRVQTQSVGPAHYSVGYFLTILGSIALERGQADQAERELRAALSVFTESTLPPDHQYIAAAEHFLGEALLAREELPAAEAILRQAVDRWRRAGAPAMRVARSESALGEVLCKENRVPEGEAHLTNSLAVLKGVGGLELRLKLKARERLARCQKKNGNT